MVNLSFLYLTANLVHLLLRVPVNSFLGICYCLHLFQHAPESSSSQSPLSPQQTDRKEEAEQTSRASHKKPSPGLSGRSNLHRTGSIKDLINKFSGQDHPQSPYSGTRQVRKSASAEALVSPKYKSSQSTPSSFGQDESAVPSITVTPPLRETSQNGTETAQRGTKISKITARIDCPVGSSTEKPNSQPRKKTQITDSGRESVADSGMGSVSKEIPLTHSDVLA